MTPRPRLLILTADFPPDFGGVQRMVHELAAGLSRSWDVTVIASRARGNGGREHEGSFLLIRTAFQWGGWQSALILGEMVLRSVKMRPDVILAGHVLVVPAAIAAARGRRPVALLLYGSELWSGKAKAIIRMLRNQVSMFIAISEFTARIAVAAGAPGHQLRIVRPGAAVADLPIDRRSILAAMGLWRDGQEAPLPYFVTVARLDEPHKGHDTFLRALPGIVARFPDFHYLIVGNGGLLGHLTRIAESSGVSGAVRFTGSVDEATKAVLIAGSRAFVMLSRESASVQQFEGFGIAFAEAALLGKPSLGGRSGAIPEVILQGETGLVVDPADPVAIVDASVWLLEHPDALTKMGARAEAHAREDLTWDIAVGRADSLLRPLLK